MIQISAYKTQSLDTSIESELYQFSLWRKLTLVQKAKLVSDWTKGCWEMSINAIRYRYPNADNQKIRQEFARLTLDVQLYNLVIQQFLNLPFMLTDPISLALVVANIFEFLNIPYLVGGSLASTLLGEPRSTQNIDFVADLKLENIQLLLEALTPRFYVSKEAIQYKQSFKIIDNKSLGKVDIFILKEHPFNLEEFQRKTPIIVRENPEKTLFLPTPEDIILQKLLWYCMGGSSDKQWRDILGVIKLQGIALDFSYLKQWSKTLQVSDLLNQAITQSRY